MPTCLSPAVARRPLAALAVAAALAALAVVAAGCGGGAGSSSTAPPRAASAPLDRVCGQRAGDAARLRHVVWIVMENKAYSDVIGSSEAPFINRLADSCGLATQFAAEAHPSLPNYIAMTSGSTQGIADDEGPAAHPLAAPSIFSQLGSDWRALQESMPAPCAQADSGPYAVRHNPAAYYTDIRAQCAAQDLPLGADSPLGARFTFVTPNLCNDMHSCELRDGDAWLAGWLPRLLSTPEYRSGSMVVFVTWDEDDGSEQQHVPTIVVSRHTRAGTRSAAPFDHYSLLATTEEILGVPKLGAAAQAASMRGAFGLG